MKLTSKIHGIIDYVVVLFLWLSPSLFHLPEATSLFTYLLGGVHLVLTIMTDFELGIIRLIPFRIHGLIELTVSIVLIGVSFYLGNIEGTLARNFYMGFGVAVFLTWLLTDYKGGKFPLPPKDILAAELINQGEFFPGLIVGRDRKINRKGAR